MSEKSSEKGAKARPTKPDPKSLKDAELDEAQGGAVTLPVLQSHLQKGRGSSS
jgi:hypothetical protein